MDSNSPLMPVVASPTKRVLIEHRAGPLAGLFQIQGTTAEFDTAEGLPTLFEGISVGDRVFSVGLVKVTKHYVLYREIAPPEGLGTFDTRQQ